MLRAAVAAHVVQAGPDDVVDMVSVGDSGVTTGGRVHVGIADALCRGRSEQRGHVQGRAVQGKVRGSRQKGYAEQARIPPRCSDAVRCRIQGGSLRGSRLDLTLNSTEQPVQAKRASE